MSQKELQSISRIENCIQADMARAEPPKSYRSVDMAVDANPPHYAVFTLQSPMLTHCSLDELFLPIRTVDAVGGNRGDVI